MGRNRRVEFSAYVHLPRRQMRCSKMGGYLRRSLKLERFVEVREHGNGWYSATFSGQSDYDRVFPASSPRHFRHYSMELYRWEPNFQFGEVPPLCYGRTFVEERVEGLPLEYWRDDVLLRIAKAAYPPLGCRAFRVDTRSEGKLPRFFFEYNGLQLPVQIMIADGLVVRLSYSRAQKCYTCDTFGHIRRNCPNRAATCSTSGRAQVHRRPNVDPKENGNPTSSGIICPRRPITEKRMPPQGAIIIEKGGACIPTVYAIGEEFSKIDGTVKVSHLNDQREILRRVTITPHIGDGPRCTKRVVCTSIDGGADATPTLEDMCLNKGASLVVVLDKSSALVGDDQIGTRLGFSGLHRAKMTFQRFGADGSALDVKGNCLLMWKREEVRVHDISVDTELSSQNLRFSASWVMAESHEEQPDGLPHNVTTCSVEGPTNSSHCTSNEPDLKGSCSLVSSNYSVSTTPGSCHESDLQESYPTAPEELPSESINISPIDTPGGDTPSADCGDAFSGEERPYEVSSSESESDEQEPDGLPHGVTTCLVECPSNSSDCTSNEPDSKGSYSLISSNYSVSTTPGYSDGSDLEGSTSYPTAPEELPSESVNVSPIDTTGGDALSSDHGDAFSGEEHPQETSSSGSESSYSGPVQHMKR